MRLVLVEWEDAYVVDASPWVRSEDAKPTSPLVFRQVGFVVEDTEEALVLTAAFAQGEQHMIAARERIPRGMVRAVVDLAEQKNPSPRGLETKKPSQRKK